MSWKRLSHGSRHQRRHLQRTQSDRCPADREPPVPAAAPAAAPRAQLQRPERARHHPAAARLPRRRRLAGKPAERRLRRRRQRGHRRERFPTSGNEQSQLQAEEGGGGDGQVEFVGQPEQSFQLKKKFLSRCGNRKADALANL